MAWTWSAPQRGRIAGAAAVLSGHRLLNSAVQRTAISLGRGDASRGLCVGFAAFLTIAGAAAPHLSSTVMTALLFISGATLVLYAALPPAVATREQTEAATGTIPSPAAPRSAPLASIHELLQQHRPAYAPDRAAFARLTAHMSHELRTPLNAILGFSELMSNEVFGPLGSSCYAAYARDIHASGISLLKSAEDALAITALLTAPEHQQRSACTHAASAAKEALAFHAPAFAANSIAVHCTIDPDADLVADPQAVRQLLINLIDDATIAAVPGAELALASRCDGSEFEICLTVKGCAAAPATDSFSLLLARTLAELCGAKLTITTLAESALNERHVTARFLRAVQVDFFG